MTKLMTNNFSLQLFRCCIIAWVVNKKNIKQILQVVPCPIADFLRKALS